MLESKIRQAAVAAPQAIAPPPVPAAPERVATPTIAAHPFAEMLRQNRLAAARPPSSEAASDKAAPAAAPEPPRNERTGARPPTAQHDAAPTKTQTTADPSRASARADDDQTPITQASTSVDDDSDARTKDAATTTPGAPADLATLTSAQAAAVQSADVLAGDARASAAPSGELACSSPADPRSAVALPLDASAAQVAMPGVRGDRRMSASAIDDSAAKGDFASDKNAEAEATGSFATLLVETRSAPAEGSLGRPSHDLTAPLAHPTGFMGPAAPSTSSGIASAAVPAPVHSAEFAAAFGMQVSVLAKEGVQRAELHLNPAEMGPVSVQITLAGSQAHVAFGADVAATRQAIEAGLPALASALRDAGFTLAGGGVGQHSNAGSGQADAGNAQRGTRVALPATTAASLDAAARRLNRRSSAGGVDLFA